MLMRPPSSIFRASMNPCPASPRRLSLGTWQSSKMTVDVSLARNPSLFSFLPGAKPGIPFSRMNAVMAGGFVGDGHGHADIAIRAVSREGFLAIQDPVIAVQTRNSLSSAGVASRFGFGKAPCSEFLAFGQRHGELAALLFASEVED